MRITELTACRLRLGFRFVWAVQVHERSKVVDDFPVTPGDGSLHTQRPEETVCTFQVKLAKERDRPMHCWEPFANFFTKRPTKREEDHTGREANKIWVIALNSFNEAELLLCKPGSRQKRVLCRVEWDCFAEHPVVHCLSPSFKHVWPNTQDVINNKQHCLSLRCSVQRQRMFRDSDLGSASWVFEKAILAVSLVPRLTGGVNHQPPRVICRQRFQAHQLAGDRAICVDEG